MAPTTKLVKRKPLPMLLGLASLCLHATQSSADWTVIPDTDFPGNCPHNTYGPGKSASDCADQCAARTDCVAISWNGPSSHYHDGNCNFKCTTLGQHEDKGEDAVIVHPKENRCKVPPAPTPAPTPETLCPKDKMPVEGWYEQCMVSEMFW